MKRQAVALLKHLTEAHGAPGDEGMVRDIVASNLAGTPAFDRTGSIIYEHSGSSKTPRVMIEAHMDEVGFVVQSITSKGFLRFVPKSINKCYSRNLLWHVPVECLHCPKSIRHQEW